MKSTDFAGNDVFSLKKYLLRLFKAMFFMSFITLSVYYLGPTHYPIIHYPLCTLPRFGFALSVRFYDTPSNFIYHCRRAFLGKTHHLPISRPTSQRFGSPDIRPRSVTPARPPPRCHIVGSLFATYMGSASCFLRTPHFWKLPLPCWPPAPLLSEA